MMIKFDFCMPGCRSKSCSFLAEKQYIHRNANPITLDDNASKKCKTIYGNYVRLHYISC